MPPPPLISKVLTCPDGNTVYAEAAGDPSKHPIVFIHGLALLGTGWAPQFKDPRLYENFYLVRYDLRGHGRSAKPFDFEAYESIRYAEEFKTVCDAFGVKKPSVVTWSLGAVVVVDVTEAWGIDYFSQIIYCGGPVFIHGKHTYIHPVVQSLLPDMQSTDADVIALTGPKYVESIFENVDKVLTYDEQLEYTGGYSVQPPTCRRHTLKRAQHAERWKKEIKQREPLLIQGTHDRHSRCDAVVEAAELYHDKFVSHIIKNIGHGPSVEAAEEVNGVIVKFLQKKLADK